MSGFQQQQHFFSGGIADLALVTMDDGRTGVLRRLKWSKVLKLRNRREFVAGMKLRERLQKDPHIVRAWQHSYYGVRPYEVLEYVSGNNLKWNIARRAYLLHRDYQQVLLEAAKGLNCVHAAGFMHLDVKPENYLVQYEGEMLKLVKLTDFDLARPADDHGSKLGGTRSYMAPEQLVQKTSCQGSDVFAFGIMAYYLISGQMPFTGKDPKQTMRHQANEMILAQPLDEFVPDVDRKWSNAVMRCLAKHAGQRYPDISGFLDDVMS